MKFEQRLTPGTIIKRYKRFLADITLENGQEITAHVPNTGAMTSCWAADQKVLLSSSDNPKRKYRYTLEMTYSGKSWVGVNTMRTNKLAIEAIKNETIKELCGYALIKPEVKIGDSRIDLCLTDDENSSKCYVEVKSTTLLSDDGNWVMFPDAVTKRGQKHLEELIKIKQMGDRAVMLFVVQREEAKQFKVAAEIDPNYSALLKEAQEKGVELLAYQCQLSKNEIIVRKKIPIFWRS